MWSHLAPRFTPRKKVLADSCQMFNRSRSAPKTGLVKRRFNSTTGMPLSTDNCSTSRSSCRAVSSGDVDQQFLIGCQPVLLEHCYPFPGDGEGDDPARQQQLMTTFSCPRSDADRLGERSPNAKVAAREAPRRSDLRPTLAVTLAATLAVTLAATLAGTLPPPAQPAHGTWPPRREISAYSGDAMPAAWHISATRLVPRPRFFDEAHPVEGLGDDRVALHRGVGARQGLGGDAGRETPSTPHLARSSKTARHGATCNGAVPVDERVDRDLPHGIGRDQRTVYPLQPAGLDATGKRENGAGRRAAPLQEFERGGATCRWSRNSVLSVPRKQPSAARTGGSPGERSCQKSTTAARKSFPFRRTPTRIEQVRQATSHLAHKTTAGTRGFDDTHHFIAVDVLSARFRQRPGFPTVYGYGRDRGQPLVALLRHLAGGVTDALSQGRPSNV